MCSDDPSQSAWLRVLAFRRALADPRTERLAAALTDRCPHVRRLAQIAAERADKRGGAAAGSAALAELGAADKYARADILRSCLSGDSVVSEENATQALSVLDVLLRQTSSVATFLLAADGVLRVGALDPRLRAPCTGRVGAAFFVLLAGYSARPEALALLLRWLRDHLNVAEMLNSEGALDIWPDDVAYITTLKSSLKRACHNRGLIEL